MDTLADFCVRNNGINGALRWYNTLLNRLKKCDTVCSEQRKRNIQRQVIILYKMSRLYLKQNDRETALNRLEQALQLFFDIEEISGKRDLLEDLVTDEIEKLELEMDDEAHLQWI